MTQQEIEIAREFGKTVFGIQPESEEPTISKDQKDLNLTDKEQDLCNALHDTINEVSVLRKLIKEIIGVTNNYKPIHFLGKHIEEVLQENNIQI